MMKTELDEGEGHRIGSHIWMAGKAFGISASLDEVVTERFPPLRKIWKIVGKPHLVIVGAYRMGVLDYGERLHKQIGGVCRLLTAEFIRPDWLLVRLAKSYADWCAKSMVRDARKQFGAG